LIFLTVGTQLRFDRLVAMVDEVAGNLDEPVVGQVHNSRVVPAHIRTASFMTQSEYRRHFENARVVIGHAGIGTVLQARDARKPLIICPRVSSLGEHRNDHQLATARSLEAQPGIYVAESVDRLRSLLFSQHLQPCEANSAAAAAFAHRLSDHLQHVAQQRCAVR
jgi:UDP-N-acetylglucosamine transferase subunit ALG13